MCIIIRSGSGMSKLSTTGYSHITEPACKIVDSMKFLHQAKRERRTDGRFNRELYSIMLRNRKNPLAIMID